MLFSRTSFEFQRDTDTSEGGQQKVKKKNLTQTYKRDSKTLKQWPTQKSDLFINKRSEEAEMTKCVILLIKGFYCSGILQKRLLHVDEVSFAPAGL